MFLVDLAVFFGGRHWRDNRGKIAWRGERETGRHRAAGASNRIAGKLDNKTPRS
jgi:hypothetical protein